MLRVSGKKFKRPESPPKLFVHLPHRRESGDSSSDSDEVGPITLDEAYEIINVSKGIDLLQLNDNAVKHTKSITINTLQEILIKGNKKRAERGYFKKGTAVVVKIKYDYLYYLTDKQTSTIFSITEGAKHPEREFTFTKLFIYSNIHPNTKVITAQILSEIYFQESAFKLNGPCNFKSPENLSYGFVKIEAIPDNLKDDFQNKTLFYFNMENMKGKELNAIPKYKCEKVKQEVVELNKCLQNFNFFHNDITSDNIIFNEYNDKFSIIDFGESGLKIRARERRDGLCDLNPQHEYAQNYAASGKRRKRRKSKKKKNKSHKTYKRKRHKSKKSKSKK
tara:strand:- start:622 stop:1626 length:1005 start_codon:yes stop_codon:yes gene_type:complete